MKLNFLMVGIFSDSFCAAETEDIFGTRGFKMKNQSILV